MAGVRMSSLPLYKRALKQPDNVRRVLEMIRDQGLKRTLDRVTGKLSAGSPTGYSAAGTVVDVGIDVTGFALGDRVACAGAGIANHAEFIDVPVNLAVKIPDSVSVAEASTVTLGSIAMQGVRRAGPTLGETFVVVGLGVLGQLTAQMLRANGCRVVGVDLDSKRIELALANGMDFGINPSIESYVERVVKLTGGFGADGVIITAASESNEIISEAMQVCRKKGRVVLVGDVGLDLKRGDFYAKELDFFISSSYGPGRYDPIYEEGGQDYPIAFVRWTENRNMQAFLDLSASGRINISSLVERTFPVSEAKAAYDSLKVAGPKPLIVLLSYPDRADVLEKTVQLNSRTAPGSTIRVGLAGASSFAQGVHLPNITVLRNDYSLQAVMSRTGANARAVATQYQANYCTTDYERLIRDETIDLVMIASRHDLHGDMALRALRAGKHVFVEKPLTLSLQHLKEIQELYTSQIDPPVLLVGFNRRFSPAVAHIKSLLKDRSTPIVANYRMNAGFIPTSHWVHSDEGGGRNLGEACHIYDLFNYLCNGAREVAVQALAISPQSAQWRKNDNFVATIKYADGSVCTLTYTALGDKSYPKERLEVYCDGKVIVLDDYKDVSVHGSKAAGWKSSSAQKGQLQELEALAACLRGGAPWPISLSEQLQATRIAFEVERQIAYECHSSTATESASCAA